MAAAVLANLAYVAAAGRPALLLAVILPGVFTGLAMSVPAMTLRILARCRCPAPPPGAGLHAQMLTFSLVSGWCVPLVYGQPLRLALAMLACVAASALAGLAAPQAAAAGQCRAGLSGRSLAARRARRYSTRRHPFTASRPFRRSSGGVCYMDRVIRHTSAHT